MLHFILGCGGHGAKQKANISWRESAFKSMLNVLLSCLSRSDFVTLPFQGAEVLLDSVMPLSGNRWGLWPGEAVVC